MQDPTAQFAVSVGFFVSNFRQMTFFSAKTISCILIAQLLLIGSLFPQANSVDLLVVNAKIYTVDNTFSTAEAVAVSKGKIVAVGTSAALKKSFAAAKTVDAKGAYLYPGFIDAHSHFYYYGNGLNAVDLIGTESWKECIERVKTFYKLNPDCKWITGRGWDQNDWKSKQYPDRKELDKLFPNMPVYLSRVDGHAAIVNGAALKAARIDAASKVSGGKIELQDGQPSGILIDNAAELVQAVIPGPDEQSNEKALLSAQQNCFAVGLTTVSDCGLDFPIVETIEKLQAAAKLKMKMYVMLSDAEKNYDFFKKRGIIKTSSLNVRGFKFYGDGALGSRGACLIKDYEDKPGWNGFMLKSPAYFDSMAIFMRQNDLQMCTHAIGDSANLCILNAYAKVLKGKNDLRWRIEHAQVVDSSCIGMFGRFSIIPSVQPTHATSDMYWAGNRLGSKRLQFAYAYGQLLRENGWLPLGTDFPVEDISPLRTFCAAVFRKDNKGYPKFGFQMENALSREDAIRGMTIWAAQAQFEEAEKGSIENGKAADFVLLNVDLMKDAAKKISTAKVLYTFVNGEIVYRKP